ncbi:MAG: mechanosensitive ion channel [Bacteroidota bacterium]|nr:mechanosensitive ion channel [Bacteroidota bacterium]
MKENIGILIEKWLMDLGLGFQFAEILSVLVILIAIVALGWLVDFLTKRILLVSLTRLIRKTKTLWDDILLEKKVFSRVAHYAPAILVFFTIEYAFPNVPVLTNLIEKGTQIYMLVLSILVVSSFLNGVNEIYNHTTGKSRGTSIKSYIQVLKIFTYFVFGIVILAILVNKDPAVFIGGLGAMAAVLMLVFRDSILGLVAGIQISANDLVRIGDWISMPSHNADGNVIEITLNTVKVQNWDKTIATIPTYTLVSQSFNNWRGMEESGGRRIMRAFHLDMNTVHFCSNEELNTLLQNDVVKQIIEDKRQRGIKITNSGIFRDYVAAYLKSRDDINLEMTFLVRLLQPESKGLPLEIYVFSKVQAWADYEAIQAEIFDHILATVPEFNLRIYQEPSGWDIAQLKQ